MASSITTATDILTKGRVERVCFTVGKRFSLPRILVGVPVVINPIILIRL